MLNLLYSKRTKKNSLVKYMVVIGVLLSFLCACGGEGGDGDSTSNVIENDNPDDSSAETIYSEDFSSNPEYSTYISSNVAANCSLEWSNGSYYAQTADASDAWYCVAGSPTFAAIESDDSFRIEFDFNPITPDWGHYPGIYFVDSSSLDFFLTETRERELSFTINWSDVTYKNFILKDGQGNVVKSDTIPSSDEMYHVVITRYVSNGDLKLEITREDGTTFFELTDLDFDVGTFDQLFIGEVQGGTKYGDSAEIRVDNIALQVGVENDDDSVDDGSDDSDEDDVITQSDLSGSWKITVSDSTVYDDEDLSEYYIIVNLYSSGTLTYTEYVNDSYYDDDSGTWYYSESSKYFFAEGDGDLCGGTISAGATTDEFSVSGTFYDDDSVTYNWIRE